MPNDATHDVAYWREQAERCRRLADSVSDPKAIAALRNMAEEFDIEADRLLAELFDGVPHPKMDMPPPRQ
jgi:hypothetical protein